jgi:hypothetical protein
MEFSQLIRSAEVERMMKLQDVLLKAMAKRISWLSAAEIIGVTPRMMRRYDGLRDRRKGKTSQRRVALEICEAVLRLYQEKYFDLNVRHFHEKLHEVEGIGTELHMGETSAASRGIGGQETAAQPAPSKNTDTIQKLTTGSGDST